LNETADVLIIGSGHSGGMTARTLTAKGISCVMLNAGPIVDLKKDTEHRTPSELPFRGFRPPGRVPHVFQADGFDANVWVDEKEVPYTCGPGEPYNWVRVRLFGGRSLFWSRQSFRLSDYELKGKSLDGFGEDWPISLADLDPYYSRAEQILRVQGRLEHLPQFPDGSFVTDDSEFSGSLQQFQAAAARRGIPFCKQRRAFGIEGLASSVNLFLPDAIATGKLEIVPNAIVRELTIEKSSGLVNGAYFVERLTGRELEVRARVVVLAAGALESTRLLLNSGIANSSGLIGRYLTDQIYGAGISCSVPAARSGKTPAGLMGGTAIIPRFRNLSKPARKFLRGYALNVSSQTGPIEARNFAEYGESLQQKLDIYHGSGLTATIMGEVLGRYENHVVIDKTKVDAWDIPILRIETRYTDNEFNMAADAVEVASELAEAAGFEVLASNKVPNPPGYSIHELGTCRMGNDSKTSVLNKWNQSHDIKNLFVVDASSFVSSGWQNPTLTIIALAMRSAEYLADQMRDGSV
jgi:choline dehydrogenase-like flavoprotein